MVTDRPAIDTGIIYVFDAFCGWSYGFAPTLIEFTDRFPQLGLEVVSGGLFAGSRRTAMSSLGYVEAANARITELTGVEFGAGYAALADDGTFVMDSEGAATAVAAIRSLAGRAIPRALYELQRAFYVDGLNIGDVDMVASIAARLDLDGDDLADRLRAAASSGQAGADFHRARSLGVTTYPTVLLREPSGVTPIATGVASLPDLEAAVTASLHRS